MTQGFPMLSGGGVSTKPTKLGKRERFYIFPYPPAFALRTDWLCGVAPLRGAAAPSLFNRTNHKPQQQGG
jgi:hypothetical protein